MSLREWLSNGWLRPHVCSRQEIQNLFAVVDRELRDCAAKGLSDDWRFGIAALQGAHAALAAAGYETPKGESRFTRASLSARSFTSTIVIRPVLLSLAAWMDTSPPWSHALGR